MEHVVFFPAPDGTPAFRRLASIDDAARFVEHLRNVENVSEASVHTLTEVPLSFKAWYRVELPNGEATQSETPQTESVSTDLDGEVAVARPSQLEIPAPATIAEAISLYQHDESTNPRNVELPDAVGSSTGITVPDREFAPREQQFAFANGSEQVASAATSGPTFVADQRGFSSATSPEPGEAQVLEPVFGSRRERGIGYFAR